ncbi:MAG: TGS domain-containing protein [Anaerolineaceae bacterium]|jgi:uridine kinase|nr:TGS domain-containing protein [Anaerolineaceae bacterium]
MNQKKIVNIKNAPSEMVDIFLPDGRVLSGPRGATVEEFLKSLPDWEEQQIVGAIINGGLRELSYPIKIESQVKPIGMADADGARIYRRSLIYLLEAAYEELFSNGDLTVDHSVSSGGFFCQVLGREPLSEDELQQLEDHMHKLVDADLPIERQQIPLDEAVAYFGAKGQTDKVRLLKYRQKPHLMMYELAGHRDYHHGYMVVSTGYLRWFELSSLEEGFILHFPRRHWPTEIQPAPESLRLIDTFREYGDWLTRLEIDSVGGLNEAIEKSRIRGVVLVSEALHEMRIAEIARRIVEQPEKSVIVIAGPSSSGKTTFSKRLAVQLLAQGISPFALEMDNYFVDRAKTPKGEDGMYDYESLNALNTKVLGMHLRQMMTREEVQLLHYDFKTGLSEPGEVVKLAPDQLIILEGIHGLNPNLIADVPQERIFRIYISALTQLNLDRQNRISTTDTRLIRRIVRDARERGYSASQTIGQWESVRRGEKRNIFPYQYNADEMFNSALAYELAVLKPFAEPILRQVPYGTPEHVEAKRLLALLEWFLPMDMELVPDNSLLKEFYGGSIFKEFKLWGDSTSY